MSILRELTGFRTVSHNSNLDLIGFIERTLGGVGIGCTIVPSADGRKASLFSCIGPPDGPGVILSGHTDVVPVAGQDWSSDPFTLRVDGGRAFGRGATDMKAFLACMLRIAMIVLRRTLAKPLILAFSYDEEIGCVGVRPMLAALDRLPRRPQLAIIGEPTGMELVLGHKGKVMGRVICKGVGGHSSDPDCGVNAVEMASEVIGAFTREKAALRVSELCDPTFAVPFTTIHVGAISGGEALNIIPETCGFDFEIRTLPEADPDDILGRLRIQAGIVATRHRGRHAANIEIAVLNEYPALATPSHEPAVSWMRDLGGMSVGINAAFGTEAGLFARELNIPAIVCGPGSVAQAHKPDEHVALEQIAMCDRFLDRLTDAIAI
ncbi:acetylornithine deacetylase [Lichenihabitans psoromatis]|uniref:acetylornithine deacetylase n=1 Tax=Lichenihabitans psoromatis TaxID=2528642 RepID=UPI0013F1465D|nr:acetylornithine deacetylase [Lichenihabitans psoromatis]